MGGLLTSALTIFGAGVCSCIETSIFGRICSDGSGKEIFMILALIVNIMTIGIGVLAAVGIAAFGVQWLTSSGDPNKLAKAKSRMYNIVIGLGFYVVLYALLEFLLPGGVLNPESLAGTVSCTPTTPTVPGGGGDSGGGGGGGGDGSGGTTPAQPTLNRLCGPEPAGGLGNFGEPNPKYDSDGSTLAAAQYDKYLTRKYTTLRGRVYYVFVQQNPEWGNLIAYSRNNSTMANTGCRLTAYAAILRSYGANVTPANMSDDPRVDHHPVAYYLRQSPTSSLSIEEGIKDISESVNSGNWNIFQDIIWNTLTAGGAAILQVNMRSPSPSIFFGNNCPSTKDCQHNMSIVDYRINNGVREVLFLDTRPWSNFPQTYPNAGKNFSGWHKMSDIINDIKNYYDREKINKTYVTTYTPQHPVDCTP